MDVSTEQKGFLSRSRLSNKWQREALQILVMVAHHAEDKMWIQVEDPVAINREEAMEEGLLQPILIRIPLLITRLPFLQC